MQSPYFFVQRLRTATVSIGEPAAAFACLGAVLRRQPPGSLALLVLGRGSRARALWRLRATRCQPAHACVSLAPQLRRRASRCRGAVAYLVARRRQARASLRPSSVDFAWVRALQADGRPSALPLLDYLCVQAHAFVSLAALGQVWTPPPPPR